MAATGHEERGSGCVSTAGFRLLSALTYQTVSAELAKTLRGRSVHLLPLRRVGDNQPLPDRWSSCSFLKTSGDGDAQAPRTSRLTFSSPAMRFFLRYKQKCLYLQFGFMIALLFSFVGHRQGSSFLPSLQETVRYLEVATMSPLSPC